MEKLFEHSSKVFKDFNCFGKYSIAISQNYDLKEQLNIILHLKHSRQIGLDSDCHFCETHTLYKEKDLKEPFQN